MISKIAKLFWIWIPIIIVMVVMDYQDWDTNTYQPLLAAVEAKKAEVIAAEASLKRIEEYRKKKDEKLAEYNSLLDEYEKVRKEFPTTPALPSLLKSLADISERIGLEFSNFKPAGEVPSELMKAAQIDVKLKGSYVQLMSFLDQVSNLQRIVNTESLTLKPGATIQNNQFRSIDADLKILTYYSEQGG
ncbi:MAG: type 4a pilus biogenesis protein PilO [Bdellovibrionota bacterium]